MAHNLDPPETVPTNQNTPRVGLWFKQKLELEIQNQI
jgi:hypothetical protein